MGGTLQVHGRAIWFHRKGDGNPAVVFLPGAGSFGLDFALVQDRVSTFATAVLYDRAGTGWSDDTDLPRGAAEVTGELQAVLRAAGCQPPYVLVGHSLGGAYAQRYAQRFPDEVAGFAGLVLLDPAHEDWNLYMPDDLQVRPTDGKEIELPPEYVAMVREHFTPLFSSFPETIRGAIIERHLGPDRLLAGVREGLNFVDVLDELRAGGARPARPMILLNGTGLDPLQAAFRSEAQLQEQLKASRRLYASVVATAFEAEYRAIPEASHSSIPFVAPDAVAQAVKDIIKRRRR